MKGGASKSDKVLDVMLELASISITDSKESNQVESRAKRIRRSTVREDDRDFFSPRDDEGEFEIFSDPKKKNHHKAKKEPAMTAGKAPKHSFSKNAPSVHHWAPEETERLKKIIEAHRDEYPVTSQLLPP